MHAFHSLWQVFDKAAEILADHKAKSNEFDNYLHTGGIPYGQTQKLDFIVERFNGRFARKNFAFHMQIERSNQTGLYSLNTYFL